VNKGVEMMSETQLVQNKSIVFIGFMGVGKTTIAKLVAKRLNRRMIDIDKEIEKKFQMPTTEIFKRYGEPFFRKQEKEMTLHYCKQPNLVISLGGGAFLQDDIKRFCLAHNIVIFLDIGFDAWKKRMPRLVATRPLLQQKTLDEMKELYMARQKIYQHHHIRIKTDSLRSKDAADIIVKRLESYVTKT